MGKLPNVSMLCLLTCKVDQYSVFTGFFLGLLQGLNEVICAQCLAGSESSNISYAYTVEVAARVARQFGDVKPRSTSAKGYRDGSHQPEGQWRKPRLTGESGLLDPTAGQECVASPAPGRGVCRWGTPQEPSGWLESGAPGKETGRKGLGPGRSTKKGLQEAQLRSCPAAGTTQEQVTNDNIVFQER